jgi:DNA polymerase-3 subunit epsilon
MLILVYDFESEWTTPVNPRMARPLEIGAVLYDSESKVPVSMYSEFLYDIDHATSPRELVELTGITDEMRRVYGITPVVGMTDLSDLINASDYVVGHNIREFDAPMYVSECERLKIPSVAMNMIDTKTDLPLPEKIKTSKLSHLAYEHGFINPFSHRALFDALTTLKLLQCYPIEEVIALSKEPNVTIRASVSYADKHLAKDRGYFWNGEEKVWQKQLKRAKAEKERTEAPFPVQIIQQSL